MTVDEPQSGAEGATPVELYGPEDGGWYTTRVHDWIGLCTDLRDPDVRGYLILRSLVIEKYKNPIRKLTLADLCELIPGPTPGKPSSLSRVRGILSALSGVGLARTPEGGPIKTSSRASAALKPMRIRINDMPAEGYKGWRNTEAKLHSITHRPSGSAASEAGRKSNPGHGEESAGRKSNPAGQKSDPRGRKSDPDSADDLGEGEVPLVPILGTATGGDASPTRSVVDGRSPSPAGSKPLEAEGGCAASSKDGPSDQQMDDTQRAGGGEKSGSKKAKHTREQLELARTVRAYFPRDLLNGWMNSKTGLEVKPLPDVPPLTDAILDALAGDVPGADRTPAQLGARIEQRWDRHGWASKYYAGEIDRLVGAAVAMVRPLKGTDQYGCANPRCDAGVNVDTGEDCTTCPARLEERKADRRRQRAQERAEAARANGAAPQPRMPAQRVEQAVWWDCVSCEASGKGEPPADHVCGNCHWRASLAAKQTGSAPF